MKRESYPVEGRPGAFGAVWALPASSPETAAIVLHRLEFATPRVLNGYRVPAAAGGIRSNNLWEPIMSYAVYASDDGSVPGPLVEKSEVRLNGVSAFRQLFSSNPSFIMGDIVGFAPLKRPVLLPAGVVYVAWSFLTTPPPGVLPRPSFYIAPPPTGTFPDFVATLPAGWAGALENGMPPWPQRLDVTRSTATTAAPEHVRTLLALEGWSARE